MSIGAAINRRIASNFVRDASAAQMPYTQAAVKAAQKGLTTDPEVAAFLEQLRGQDVAAQTAAKEQDQIQRGGRIASTLGENLMDEEGKPRYREDVLRIAAPQIQERDPQGRAAGIDEIKSSAIYHSIPERPEPEKVDPLLDLKMEKLEADIIAQKAQTRTTQDKVARGERVTNDDLEKTLKFEHDVRDRIARTNGALTAVVRVRDTQDIAKRKGYLDDARRSNPELNLTGNESNDQLVAIEAGLIQQNALLKTEQKRLAEVRSSVEKGLLLPEAFQTLNRDEQPHPLESHPRIVEWMGRNPGYVDEMSKSERRRAIDEVARGMGISSSATQPTLASAFEASVRANLAAHPYWVGKEGEPEFEREVQKIVKEMEASPDVAAELSGNIQ